MKFPLKASPFVLVIILTLASASCKDKPKDDSESFFPVVSFLNSQVAMIDTSLFSIKRLDPVDSSRTDTTFIAREDFRKAAADFLSIPDISADEYRGRYRETKQFDEGLNLVILTYDAIDRQNEVLQSEQVTIKPGIGGDKVQNIIISMVTNSKDSSVEKKMLWNADESFQVSTIKQLPGRPETAGTYKVTWNESEY